MVEPNYAFAKRQRALAKKARKEEKRLRKTGTNEPPQKEIQPPPAGDDKIVP